MPAVMDSQIEKPIEIPVETDSVVSVKPVSQPIKYGRGRHPNTLRNLKPHRAGTPPPRGAGRKHGSKNFATILREAEPDLATAYVEHALNGSAPLLQDARKVHAPIESDTQSSTLNTALITFLESQAVSHHLTTQTLLPVPEPKQIEAVPASLTPSAGTEIHPV